MWQPVLMIDGFIFCILGLSMLFPAALDMYDARTDWSPFFSTALMTLFIGLMFFLSNKGKISNDFGEHIHSCLEKGIAKLYRLSYRAALCTSTF